MRIEIDLAEVRSAEQLHGVIAERAMFPLWYGNNLDALFDMLTEAREMELIFLQSERLDEALRGYFDALVSTIEEAERSNPLLRHRICAASPEERCCRTKEGAGL